MGILGSGKKKEFKRGMEAGAKPFEEKFYQVGTQIEEAKSEITEKVDGLSEINEIILNELSIREKKELFDLNLEKNIQSLDYEDKEFALGILYTVAQMIEDISENQKEYLLRLQHYFDIKEPNTSISVEKVENVEDLKIQKALYQLVNEFIFLYDGEFYDTELKEVIYDHFSINNRTRKEIRGDIINTVRLMGMNSLCDKYGFIIEETICESQNEKCEMEELFQIIKDYCYEVSKYGSNEAIKILPDPVLKTYYSIDTNESIRFKIGDSLVVTDHALYFKCGNFSDFFEEEEEEKLQIIFSNVENIKIDELENNIKILYKNSNVEKETNIKSVYNSYLSSEDLCFFIYCLVKMKLGDIIIKEDEWEDGYLKNKYGKKYDEYLRKINEMYDNYLNKYSEMFFKVSQQDIHDFLKDSLMVPQFSLGQRLAYERILGIPKEELLCLGDQIIFYSDRIVFGYVDLFYSERSKEKLNKWEFRFDSIESVNVDFNFRVIGYKVKSADLEIVRKDGSVEKETLTRGNNCAEFVGNRMNLLSELIAEMSKMYTEFCEVNDELYEKYFPDDLDK